MNYIFETPHLRVRRFRSSDAEDLYKNHLEEEVKNWIPNESYADLEETREAIAFYEACVDKGQLPYVLAIELKETGELIGDTGVNEVEGAPGEVEIGYSICKKYSGRGFATEVVLAMTDFVVNNFDVKVLYGRVMRGNNASVRIMEKCGFMFLREEFGAEDDPYGKGILVYRKVCNKVLLTAFSGTSAEALVQGSKYRLLLLPNDKVKDSELLIETISKESFDYIISFGQRPNMKNKVHIETTAKSGDWCIDTEFDCSWLQKVFEQKGIDAKISGNAGTSFCNQLYFNGLKYINQRGMNTKIIFVHVPFLKNVDDLEDFRERVLEVLDEVKCMIEKDDWRLLNDVEHLKNKALNPTDGEDITQYAKHLKKCMFCWEKVQDTPHQWWFIPEDLSCCICEECYNDFKEMFHWKKLDGYDIDWMQGD